MWQTIAHSLLWLYFVVYFFCKGWLPSSLVCGLLLFLRNSDVWIIWISMYWWHFKVKHMTIYVITLGNNGKIKAPQYWSFVGEITCGKGSDLFLCYQCYINRYTYVKFGPRPPSVCFIHFPWMLYVYIIMIYIYLSECCVRRSLGARLVSMQMGETTSAFRCFCIYWSCTILHYLCIYM